METIITASDLKVGDRLASANEPLCLVDRSARGVVVVQAKDGARRALNATAKYRVVRA